MKFLNYIKSEFAKSKDIAVATLGMAAVGVLVIVISNLIVSAYAYLTQ